ncbi:hypothetical protein CMV_009199 [Castanea mollissima]|uniref:Uncharacterized protein n=1 Tax=Castanea mollissima TaxID=60419 RepID=A0A8J4R613_9ROSI|nr:hypothetical protein CMV_009199 [Castanea mollissima]
MNKIKDKPQLGPILILNHKCTQFLKGILSYRLPFSTTFAQREREREGEKYGRRAWSGNYLQGHHGASTKALALNHRQGHVRCHVVLDSLQSQTRWSCSTGLATSLGGPW